MISLRKNAARREVPVTEHFRTDVEGTRCSRVQALPAGRLAAWRRRWMRRVRPGTAGPLRPAACPRRGPAGFRRHSRRRRAAPPPPWPPGRRRRQHRPRPLSPAAAGASDGIRAAARLAPALPIPPSLPARARQLPPARRRLPRLARSLEPPHLPPPEPPSQPPARSAASGASGASVRARCTPRPHLGDAPSARAVVALAARGPAAAPVPDVSPLDHDRPAAAAQPYVPYLSCHATWRPPRLVTFRTPST